MGKVKGVAVSELGDSDNEAAKPIVLVVEDEEAVRSLVTRYLQKKGYTVLSAGDGQEALELLQSSVEQPHILVSDVVMPRLDGPSLVKKLRPTYPDLTVIFMSGYVDNKFSVPGLERDSYRFLAKPFSLTVLVDTLRELTDIESGEFESV